MATSERLLQHGNGQIMLDGIQRHALTPRLCENKVMVYIIPGLSITGILL